MNLATILDDEIKTILSQVNPMISKRTRHRIPYAKMEIYSDLSHSDEKHIKIGKNYFKSEHHAILDCYEKNLINEYDSLKENWLLNADQNQLVSDEELSGDESHYSLDFEDEIEMSEMGGKRHHHHHHHHHNHNKKSDKDQHHRESEIFEMKSSIRAFASIKSRFLNKKYESAQSINDGNASSLFSHIYENETFINDSLFGLNQNKEENDHFERGFESKACSLM
jgi:hypothetical protein